MKNLYIMLFFCAAYSQLNICMNIVDQRTIWEGLNLARLIINQEKEEEIREKFPETTEKSSFRVAQYLCMIAGMKILHHEDLSWNEYLLRCSAMEEQQQAKRREKKQKHRDQLWCLRQNNEHTQKQLKIRNSDRRVHGTIKLAKQQRNHKATFIGNRS